MDIQIFVVSVGKGIGLDFLNAFLDPGETDQLTEPLLTFAQVDERRSDRHKDTKIIQGNHLFVKLKKLIL